MSGEQQMYELKEENGETLILEWVVYFILRYLNTLKFVNYAMDVNYNSLFTAMQCLNYLFPLRHQGQ